MENWWAGPVSEGLMRLEGELTVVGREVNGRFSLGITPGTLARIPGAESKVFQPGRDGLLWSPVIVRGTLDEPKEDVSKRLIAAAGERMFELIPETGLRILRHSDKSASEMALDILERGRDAVGLGSEGGEEGGSLLETGVGQVRDGVGAVLGQIPLLGPGLEPVIPEDPEVEPEADPLPDSE